MTDRLTRHREAQDRLVHAAHRLIRQIDERRADTTKEQPKQEPPPDWHPSHREIL